MHKILFTHPLIGSYSAFLLLGIVSGYLLSRWRARKLQIPGKHVDDVTLLIAILSLFGARLFSWIFYFPPGVNLWKALWDPAGGMVFYGGLIFGFVALVIYTAAAKLKLAQMLDLFAPGLAVGLAFGRVGCFMAGCCWGDICAARSDLLHLPSNVTTWQIQTVPAFSSASFPLAVRFPQHTGAFEQHQRLGLIPADATQSFPVHPVQLYEAALSVLLCMFLCRPDRSPSWPGRTFCLLLVGYGVIRFITEIFRADNPPNYAGLTLSQVISILLIFTAAAITAWRARRPAAPQSGSNHTEPIEAPIGVAS